MELALLVTSRCNASCTHCTTDSSPYRSTALARSEIFELMNEAARLREPGDPLVFCISGGEAFTQLRQLLDVVRHGTGLGGEVSCTTNGFWATSDERARAILEPLREAGLHALGVSTSRFHQRYVPFERVCRAIAAARNCGIRTVLKVARTRSDRGLRALARSAGADQTEIFPVVPYLREGAALDDAEYIRTPGLPAGRCPAAILTVREDGRAYTCCNPGGFSELLALGNALESGLDAVAHRFHTSPVQHVLRERGPAHLARRLRDTVAGQRLRAAYADPCDLCAHLSSDPQLAAAARVAAETSEARQISTLLQKRPARGDLPQFRRSIIRKTRGF